MTRSDTRPDHSRAHPFGQHRRQLRPDTVLANEKHDLGIVTVDDLRERIGNGADVLADRLLHAVAVVTPAVNACVVFVNRETRPLDGLAVDRITMVYADVGTRVIDRGDDVRPHCRRVFDQWYDVRKLRHADLPSRRRDDEILVDQHPVDGGDQSTAAVPDARPRAQDRRRHDRRQHGLCTKAFQVSDDVGTRHLQPAGGVGCVMRVVEVERGEWPVRVE